MSQQHTGQPKTGQQQAAKQKSMDNRHSLQTAQNHNQRLNYRLIVQPLAQSRHKAAQNSQSNSTKQTQSSTKQSRWTERGNKVLTIHQTRLAIWQHSEIAQGTKITETRHKAAVLTTIKRLARITNTNSMQNIFDSGHEVMFRFITKQQLHSVAQLVRSVGHQGNNLNFLRKKNDHGYQQSLLKEYYTSTLFII